MVGPFLGGVTRTDRLKLICLLSSWSTKKKKKKRNKKLQEVFLLKFHFQLIFAATTTRSKSRKLFFKLKNNLIESFSNDFRNNKSSLERELAQQ